MQTSMVFSQLRWPGMGGTVNDCAPVSAIQAVNVTSPWLPLVGIRTFRKAAGAPDAEGGLVTSEVVAGIKGCYPLLADSLIVLRGGRWAEFRSLVEDGHPFTVAMDSSKLPAGLNFGFTGFHQVTVAVKNGKVKYANPLAQPYARWLTVTWDLVRSAVMAYGAASSGRRGVWAVGLPTDDEAFDLRYDWLDETPFDQDDIDEATAHLQAKIDAALEALAPEG